MKHHKVNANLPKGWQKGAPPHVGWWRLKTSFDKLDGAHLAWFDGRAFGLFRSSGCPPSGEEQTGFWSIGEKPWSYYWPTNARVARINPQTGECTGAGPCPYETAGMAWPFKKGGKK